MGNITGQGDQYNITPKDDKKQALLQIIKGLPKNERWSKDLSDYNSGKQKEEDVFNYHRENRTKIASLKNRVFSDDEWGEFEKLKDHLKLGDGALSMDALKNKYINVTNSFFSKHKKDGYKHPFAEINRIFAGYYLNNLCPIVDDGALKKLIKSLKDKGFVDENIYSLKQKEGGWIIRSWLVNALFETLCGSDNENKVDCKTAPWALYKYFSEQEIKNLLVNNHNVILTGAPGTGKTYNAQQTANLFAGEKHVKLVQFHPSYDYTDFVEGLRPNKDNENTFSRVDGVFKKFCKCAILGLNVDASDKVIKEEEEKLQPQSSQNPNELSDSDNTQQENDKPYVIIIDEINRGEISKIFGELFFCVESSHRGKKERVDTQYQNLLPNYDLFRKGFYVPKNVYIIGTMNDIDRSVESMDFAFRRRFAFYEIVASSDMLDGMVKVDSKDIENLKLRMNKLNKELLKDQYGLSSAYQIGGAYFKNYEKYYVANNYNDSKATKMLWDYHLKGILFEYFRGLPVKDVEKNMEALKKVFDQAVKNDGNTSEGGQDVEPEEE